MCSSRSMQLGFVCLMFTLWPMHGELHPCPFSERDAQDTKVLAL